MLVAPGELRLEDVPNPGPGRGEVTLRVEAVGVCGSDVHGYLGLNGRRRPGTVMGHEVSGTVEQVGPEVEASWLQQAVTVNPVLGCEQCAACRTGNPQWCPDKVLVGCVPEHPGGFAQLLTVPATTLVSWAGPAPLHWGPFAEPLAVGLHAVAGVEVTGACVLVIGSGPVAIAATLAARQAGAAAVTMTEGDEDRLALLRELGIGPQPAAQIAAAAPFDVVVDCVADDASLAQALAQVKIRGSVVVVGLGRPSAAISVERLVQGDRLVRGSAQYSRASYAEAAQWLSSGRLDVSRLLSPLQPLVRAPQIFRELASSAARPVKTLLTPR